MEPISVHTGSGEFDGFPNRVRRILSKVVSEFQTAGVRLRGYRSPDTTPIWIRDHTHQVKAARYFDSEADLKGPYDFFISRQREDGSFWEWACEDRPLKRVECEADVEYLMVLGAFRVWQATGDADWFARHVPALERGLGYLMSDPIRWSPEHGLVKRPFTIDTWDFQYMEELPEDGRYRTRLGPYSRFGIMHGDNSGLYAAGDCLATFCRQTGDVRRAERWQSAAEQIRARANELLFNGRHYRHFLHIDPVAVPGVDEEKILSLSNTYDINRGLPSHASSVSILDEYAQRAESLDPRPFAPWFTIQPCLPAERFGDLGHDFGAYRYINGGLMPFVGGELARAALEHGREAFGVAQLRTYARTLERTGQAYFCYRYDGSPDLYRGSLVPHDGWGASAMLYALIEGLAGVRDLASGFRRVRLSPRWPAAGETDAEVRVGYAATGAQVAYAETVDVNRGRLRLTFRAPEQTTAISLHVLLPAGYAADSLRVNGQRAAFNSASVEGSRYADFEVPCRAGECELAIRPGAASCLRGHHAIYCLDKNASPQEARPPARQKR